MVDKSGKSPVKLAPTARAKQPDLAAIAAKRKAALGALADKYRHLLGTDALDVPPSMTDEELEERFQRKFNPEC